MKITGRRVAVGCRNSNDVHLLGLDRFGALDPLDSKSVGASGVTGIAVCGSHVVAGTFAGEVHAFQIHQEELIPLGTSPTGGDITDITVDPRGRWFVTGGIPPRLDAFRFTGSGFELVGGLDFPAGPGPTSRTLAAVLGWQRTAYVVLNEFQGNQTVVIKAQPE